MWSVTCSLRQLLDECCSLYVQLEDKALSQKGKMGNWEWDNFTWLQDFKRLEELEALLGARPYRYERRYPQAVEYLSKQVKRGTQESLRDDEGHY